MECKLERTTVFYEVFGEGSPIILLHGFGGDHRDLVDDIEPIFNERVGWQRIYLDWPGFGRTPAPDWMTNADKTLDILVEFIDTLIPGERFAIYGVSGGAYLVHGIVYRRCSLINGLALDVPVTVLDPSKRQLAPNTTLIEDKAFLSELSVEEAELLQGAVVKTRKVFDIVKPSDEQREEFGDLEFQMRVGSDLKKFAYTFDVLALPKPMPAPTLIITGRQDFEVGYRDAWSIIENYPRSTYVVLDRAGHWLGAEQPELYNLLMNEWLNRVEEFIDTL